MTDMKTKQYIASRLRAAGLKPHAVAGIMGNIEAESGFNPKAVNGSSGAFGLVQWLGGRKTGLEAYARSKGKSASNVDIQVDYIIKEIKSGKQQGRTGTVTIASLNQQKGAGAAAEFFDTNYERSEGTTVGQRRSAAKGYMSVAKNADGGGGATVASVPGSKDGFITWVPKVGLNVTQQFGNPNSRYKAGFHTGTDIGGNSGGQPIRWAPPVEGKVIRSGSDGAYGNHVYIRDEKGRTWLLAHMQGSPPAKGTRLRQGDLIGRVGNTGNSSGAHLHIEMTEQDEPWRYGQTVKPKLRFRVDPDGSTYDLGDGAERTPKGYFGNIGNYSASYLDAPGNEELKRIYRRAKKEDWSEQKVQNAIYKSDWYKTRSNSQRSFDKMTGADQAATLREKVAEVRRTALEMGVSLTREQIRFEAMRLARDGDTPDQLRYWLGNKYEYNPEAATSGFVRSFQEDVQDMARAYGYTVGENELELWTREAIQGNLDASSYEDEMRVSAQQRFPELKLEGRTLADALAPWMDTAVQELGIDPSEIDLRDPKWTDMINPDTGKMYTNSEYRKHVRTDSRYGWRDTQNGKRELSQAAGIIGRLFGASRNG